MKELINILKNDHISHKDKHEAIKKLFNYREFKKGDLVTIEGYEGVRAVDVVGRPVHNLYFKNMTGHMYSIPSKECHPAGAEETSAYLSSCACCKKYYRRRDMCELTGIEFKEYGIVYYEHSCPKWSKKL